MIDDQHVYLFEKANTPQTWAFQKKNIKKEAEQLHI